MGQDGARSDARPGLRDGRLHDSVTSGPITRPGIELRPVAVPADLATWRGEKAVGRVESPLRVHWSGAAPRTYDLDDPIGRHRVYELVLTEGTEDDVRRYIRPDVLVQIWEEIVLPQYVRRAWAGWIAQHR